MARFTYNPRTGVLSGLQGISIGTPAQTIEEFVTSYISNNTETVYDSDLVVSTVLKNLDIAGLSSLSGGGSGMTDSDLAVVAKLRDNVDSDSPVLQYLSTQIENILARLDSDYALTKANEYKILADIDSDKTVNNTKFVLQQIAIDSESAKVQALKERVYGLVRDNDSDQVKANSLLRDNMDSDQAVQDARLFNLEVDLDSERSLLTFLRSFVFAYDPEGANIFNYYSSAGGFGRNPFHDSDLVIESAIKGFNVAAASFDSDRTVQTINKNLDVAALSNINPDAIDSDEVYNMGIEHGWFYDSDKVMSSVTKNTVAIINIVNNNLGKVDSDFVFTMLDSEEVVNMFAEHGIATNTAITGLKADLDSETARIQLLLSNADSDQIGIAELRRDADSDTAVIQALKTQADLDSAYITLIRADLDSDTTAIQALRTDMDSESARVNTRLSSIESDVSTATASNTVQNSRLTSLEARADSDESVLQLLDGRVTTLENASDSTGFDSDQVVAIINENSISSTGIEDSDLKVMADLRNDVDSDSIRIQDHSTRIGVLEAAVDGTGFDSDQIVAIIAENETAFDDSVIVARLDSDSIRIQDHGTRIGVLEAAVDDTGFDSDQVVAIINENSTSINDSDLKAVADLRTDLDSDFNAFNTRVSDNYNSIQTLNSTTNSQGGRITLLEARRDSESAKVQTINGTVATLQSTQNAYGGRITSLEQNEDSDAIVVNTLRSTVDSLRSDIDSETSRIQLILLSQDSDALSIAGLVQDADSDAAQIAELLRQADSDAAAIQALKTDLSADITTLQTRADSDEIAISARLPLAGGTMSGDIDGNGNKVLFANVYSNEVDLPDASTYHGMFAHVHATGAGYFAHAGNWIRLSNHSDAALKADLDSDSLRIGALEAAVDDTGFDSDQVVAIITENETNYDDTALVSRLDSDSLKIQAMQESIDALEAGTYNDGPLVARLDSDTLAISALQTQIDSIGGLTDSDLKVVADLRNDVDSDRLKLSALKTQVDSLGGNTALSVKSFTFTSAANDSDFSGVDNNGQTLSYVVGKIHVYLNGTLLTDNVDYLATDGTTVSLIDAPDSDDVVTVIKFLGTVQAGFDSDQIVAIINENTSAGSIDSDVAAVAALRRDADSDSIRIQEIATSLEQINGLVDSDLKAIADLRNDVDSDSIKIQALQETVDGLSSAGSTAVSVTEVTDSDAREAINSPKEGDLVIQYNSGPGTNTGITNNYSNGNVMTYTGGSGTTYNNGQQTFTSSVFAPHAQVGDVIVVENSTVTGSNGYSQTGTLITAVCELIDNTTFKVMHTFGWYWGSQPGGTGGHPASGLVNRALKNYFDNASNARGDIPNGAVAAGAGGGNPHAASFAWTGGVATLYRMFDTVESVFQANPSSGFTNGAPHAYDDNVNGTVVAAGYSKPEVWLYQDSDDLTPAGWKSHFKSFDSDQIVSIINENVVSGSVDSDVTAIAALRRDADSDSIRISNLRSDVDSDSTKLQALQETVDGLSSGGETGVSVTEVVDSDGREGISSPKEGDLAIQYSSYPGTYTGISHDFTVNNARSQLWAYTVYARSANSLTTDNGNGRFQWSNSTFNSVVKKGDVIVVEDGFAQTTPGVNSGGVNYNSGYTGTFIFVCHTPQVGAAAPYYNIQAYGHVLSPSSIGFTLNSSLYGYFNNSANPRGSVPSNAQVVRSYMNSNNSSATQLLQGRVAKLYRFFDPATYADGYDNNGTADPYNGSNDATIDALPYGKAEVWLYQDSDDLTPTGWKSHFKSFDSDQIVSIINENTSTGFDSDQVVSIINENTSAGGLTDSDLAIVAKLRNDIDSETARIQLLLLTTDSDSLSLAGLKRDADSDASAIVILRQNAESDSLAIQALSSSLAPRLDSDELAIQAIKTDMDVNFNVGNSGASAYTFTGDGFPSSVNNPTLYLERGNTYNFRLAAAGHPFEIRLASGGSAYSSGVTNNGAQTGLTTFVVPMDAPESLVYQCTLHSGMVGTIKIGKQGFDSDQIASMVAENETNYDDTALVARLDSDTLVISALRRDIDSDSTKLQALQETVNQLRAEQDSDSANSGGGGAAGFDSDQIVAIISENPGSQTIVTTVFTFTASNNDSDFSGSDDNGVTLSYTPGKIHVYLNGILLTDTTDYLATDGTSVSLVSAPDSDDILTIIKFLGTVQSGFDSDQIVSIINENSSGGSGITDSDLKAVADLRNDVDSDSIVIQSLDGRITTLENAVDNTGFDSDQVVAIINENSSSSGSGITDSDLKVVADLRNDLDSELRASRTTLSISRLDYTATQGQTAFTGLDDNGNTLSYSVGKIQVFLNGILMLDTTDYAATNGATITLVTAADSDDKLSVIKYLGADATQNLNVTRFTFKYGVDGNSVVGDSDITGSDEHGNTLSYTAGKIQVYSNGILLEDSDDYIATDGSTITLRAAPDSDDVVSIFKYLGTIQSGFDSEQVVSIVNENSSGGVTTGKAIAMAIVFGG